MLHTCLVQTDVELAQIFDLNQQNLKQHLSESERCSQGFVTWLYEPPLLQQMHRLAPSVVVKDGATVVGYALVTLREAAAFHPDLAAMFSYLAPLQYKHQPLLQHNFYCMGQVCIEKAYRGIGVLAMLYEGHRKHYASRFDLLVTEISTSNHRSQKAHEKTGFTTIHTYADKIDEWNVVVWDWQEKENKKAANGTADRKQ
jgi:hypothetical protein